jgi:hypothetical protein
LAGMTELPSGPWQAAQTCGSAAAAALAAKKESAAANAAAQRK